MKIVVRRTRVLVFLAAILVSLAAGIVALSTFQGARERAMIHSARLATVDLFTYDYRTIGRDQARARARMTRNFAKTYDFNKVRDDAISLRAVQEVSIRTAEGTEIETEVIVVIETTTRSKFGPATNTVSLRLGMAEENGRWLLDSLTVAA